VIRSTTSFGFCWGYCRTTLDITPTEMVFVEDGWRDEVPVVRRTARVSSEEWQALLSAVDRSRIEPLPARIGCPDCADGGAESLEVVAGDWQKTVTFEYDAALPQLQPLLERVRVLRRRFPLTRR
jgi:hypothetical protein